MKPQTQTTRFRVDLTIESLTIGVSFPCQLSIIWKKGTTEVSTQSKPNLNLEKCEARFNETLSMDFSLQVDPKTKKYEERHAKLTIHILVGSSVKTAGIVSFDLSKFALFPNKDHKVSMPLERCPDSEAKLFLRVKLTQTADSLGLNSSTLLDVSTSNANELNKSFDAASALVKSDIRSRLFNDSGTGGNEARSNSTRRPSTNMGNRSKSPTISYKNAPKVSFGQRQQPIKLEEEDPAQKKSSSQNTQKPQVSSSQEERNENKVAQTNIENQEIDFGLEGPDASLNEAHQKKKQAALVPSLDLNLVKSERNKPAILGVNPHERPKTQEVLSATQLKGPGGLNKPNSKPPFTKEPALNEQGASDDQEQSGYRPNSSSQNLGAPKKLSTFGSKSIAVSPKAGGLTYNTSKGEIERLEVELEASREIERRIKEEWKREAQKKNQQIDQMESEIDLLNREVNARKEAAVKSEQEHSLTIAQLQRKIESLSHDLSISKKQERTSSSVANSNDTLSQYAQQISDLKKKLRESEVAREKALSCQTGLTLDIERYQKELERSSRMGASNGQGVSVSREKELLQENYELKKSLEALKLEMALSKNQKSGKESEDDEIPIESDKDQLILNIQNELVEVQKKCDNLKEKKRQLKEEIYQLNETIEQLQSPQKQTKGTAQSLGARGGQGESNMEVLKRLAEKELEVKKLQRSLAEVSETKMQVAGLLEENQRLKEQLERSQAQSKKGKEPGNLKGKVEELEDENTTMKEELERMRAAYSKLEIEKKKSEVSFKKSEEQLKEMAGRLAKMEEDFVIMKKNVGDALNIGAEISDSRIFDRLMTALCNTKS